MLLMFEYIQSDLNSMKFLISNWNKSSGRWHKFKQYIGLNQGRALKFPGLQVVARFGNASLWNGANHKMVNHKWKCKFNTRHDTWAVNYVICMATFLETVCQVYFAFCIFFFFVQTQKCSRSFITHDKSSAMVLQMLSAASNLLCPDIVIKSHSAILLREFFSSIDDNISAVKVSMDKA